MIKKLNFLTIIFLCILSGIEVDLFTPSFPYLQDNFQISPLMIELTLSLNFIAYGASSLIMGALGDYYGRKHTIFYGMILFIVGSFLCLSTHYYSLLLIGRVLQGIGIAAPSILIYVIVSNRYSLKNIALINGVVTFAMSFAPVLGSLICSYFGWQGNFIFLLIFAIICLILTVYFLQDKSNFATTININVKTFIASYASVMKDRKVLWFLTSCCFLSVPYWVFTGISPLLYMKSFNITIKEFGLYQGSLSFAFFLISILNSFIVERINLKLIFKIELAIIVISLIILFILAYKQSTNANYITTAMILLSMGIVMPINIIYYKALEINQAAKGRIAALYTTIKLFVTAISLEIVGYFYNGNFKNIGIIMVISLIIALIGIATLYRKNWINDL